MSRVGEGFEAPGTDVSIEPLNALETEPDFVNQVPDCTADRYDTLESNDSTQLTNP
jgi:hypothetical protein